MKLKLARLVALSASGLFSLAGCRPRVADQVPDSPRLTPGVVLQDVSFRSAALHREMVYRVIRPVRITADRKLPVVLLLHGGGGGFRDWSNYSDVSKFAAGGLILVMPEGESSYFANAADRPQDRFEDYVVTDLITDVASKFPVAENRGHRAIVGVSMGGFGAVDLGLRHPDLFAFVGGLSPALDVPTRPFSIRRLEQWRRHRAIFGPWNGKVQRDNDPFTLALTSDAGAMPYLFFTCGAQEGLLATNRAFAALLEKRRIPYEFHVVPGGHDWNQWNAQVPELFRMLSQHLKSDSTQGVL